MERRQIRLGLVGYGEVGSGLGTGLRQEGLKAIAAYDIGAFEGPYSALIQGRAREAGVTLVRSPQELAKAADYLISAVPGSESVTAASAYRDHLGSHHVYVDIASATPSVKRRVAEALEPSGATVGDGGIMGSPLQDGHRFLIKASGPAAQAFHDALSPWNMRIDVVSSTLGAGSGIKIVRSVVMKGMEALFVECALASARHGIQDEVFESISAFMDARPFMETVRFLLRTDVIHAERRAEEAGMSADALDDVGLEPVMTRSTARTLQRVADLNLKQQFGGLVPDDYKTAVEAIDLRLRSLGLDPAPHV
ncbi:NAD(P)-dependent oxidoreductase [bacterium]|nr:MAG: NAD(P)-dependent oxidoreductase [bacterium]